MNFYVYMHTAPNGKKYIGQTSKTVRERWIEHVWDSEHRCNTAFRKAIKKYGADSFKHEVLERMTTEAGARKAERLWIKELNTKAPRGYNLTDGGEGTLGLKWSKESRDRFRVPKTEAHRENMRKNRPPLTPERSAYLSNRQLGEKNPSCKFSDATIREIRELAKAGLSQHRIAKIHNISQQYVSEILRNICRSTAN